MYQGEVSIEKDVVDKFLEIANDLRIRQLCQEKEDTNYIPEDTDSEPEDAKCICIRRHQLCARRQ